MRKKIKLIIFFFTFFSFFQTEAIYCKNNLTEEALIKEASSAFLIQSDSIFESKYNAIVIIYRKKKYIKALTDALGFYDELKYKEDYKSLYLITTLIADIYDKTNKYPKALEYHKEALSILKKVNLADNTNNNILVDPNYAKTILRIGSFYQKTSNLDSAKLYYKKLDKLTSLNNEILGYRAASFGNLSGIYERDSLFNEAKEYANKAIEIHKKRNDKRGQATALNNLGNIYLSLGDFEKAKETYLKGIDLIENNNSANAVRFKANLYYNLAWAMRNLKDYKAYDFQELSYEIEDGIRDKEVRTMIEKVAADYDVKGIKKEEENKRLKAQRTTWIFGIGGLVAILSLLYWVNYYKLRQKNLGLELSQTQLIQNQNIEKIKSESQTRILNATIDGKESERKQIAEILHDSVSALLSSANLHLQATRSQFNGKTPIEIDKTQKIITEASEKIRDLSHTLVSSVLLKFGLKFAIKDLADKYSNSKITIDTRIGDIGRFEQNFEIKMYNIIQEFINNILKHSQAEKAMIKLDVSNGKLSLRITDDGIGFDKTKIAVKDGLGINQIDARIQMMKGDFNIDSSKKNGTVIKVVLPIIEKEEANLV